MSEYEAQAEQFLKDHGLSLKVAWKGSDAPKWSISGPHGDKYRVTIKRAGRVGSVSFDFWGSQNDKMRGIAPTSYSILACISSDIYCPQTHADFCSEYGYDEDSRKDYQLFRRASAFARKLNAFFSEKEIEALSEIS